MDTNNENAVSNHGVGLGVAIAKIFITGINWYVPHYTTNVN